MISDARVPIRFGPASEAGDDDILLLEGDIPAPSGPGPGQDAARFRLPAAASGHPAGCACCVPRGPAAEALGRLFADRARGRVRFFRRVLVVAGAAGEAAVRAALAADPVASGCFRLGA